MGRVWVMWEYLLIRWWLRAILFSKSSMWKIFWPPMILILDILIQHNSIVNTCVAFPWIFRHVCARKLMIKKLWCFSRFTEREFSKQTCVGETMWSSGRRRYLSLSLLMLYSWDVSVTNIPPADQYLPLSAQKSFCRFFYFFPCVRFVFQRLKSDNDKLWNNEQQPTTAS